MHQRGSRDRIERLGLLHEASFERRIADGREIERRRAEGKGAESHIGVVGRHRRTIGDDVEVAAVDCLGIGSAFTDVDRGASKRGLGRAGWTLLLPASALT
jgi:hypothetical protein